MGLERCKVIGSAYQFKVPTESPTIKRSLEPSLSLPTPTPTIFSWLEPLKVTCTEPVRPSSQINSKSCRMRPTAQPTSTLDDGSEPSQLRAPSVTERFPAQIPMPTLGKSKVPSKILSSPLLFFGGSIFNPADGEEQAAKKT